MAQFVSHRATKNRTVLEASVRTSRKLFYTVNEYNGSNVIWPSLPAESQRWLRIAEILASTNSQEQRGFCASRGA